VKYANGRKIEEPRKAINGTMLTAEMILSWANPDIAIGIGSEKGSERVAMSADMAAKEGYGQVTIYENPDRMIMDLLEGEIMAGVRGDMASNDVLAAIRHGFGVNMVMRAAALQPHDGPFFFLAPVGVDEGWELEEKIEFIRLGKEMLDSIGIMPRFGILSGGRYSDTGRAVAVDRSIAQAEEVVKWGNEIGLDIEYDEILIEKAASSRNFILAPDGVTGNLIFRTLHFLGRGRALGAPVLNIDRVFVDTSRAKQSYVDSIALASAMAVKGCCQVI